LVDTLLVSADEPVKTNQAVATLRSPTIVEAQQQFLAAIADESLATDRLRRTQLLIEGKAIPERELNIAQAESARARARLDERTQLLSLMGLSEAQIAEVRTTRRIVPTVTIYSPINGTVVKRHTSPGERIDAAAPLFTIAELDPLWVELQVPAARLPNLTVGSEVSLPAQRARGKIIRIGRTVDPSTQSAIGSPRSALRAPAFGRDLRSVRRSSSARRLPTPIGACRYNPWCATATATGCSFACPKVSGRCRCKS